MKKSLLTFVLPAIGMLAGGLLTSCSQDDMPALDTSANVLVKAPKISAYSGDTYFGHQTGTRSSEESLKPKALTQDEINTVIAKFKAIDEHFIGNYSGEIEGAHLYNGFFDFNTEWLKDGEDFYVVNISNNGSNDLANNHLRIWHQDIAYDISADTYENGDFTLLEYVDLWFTYESYNPQIHVEKAIKDLSFNVYKDIVSATNPLYNPDRNNYNKFGNYPPFRYVTFEGMERDEDWEYAYIALYSQKCEENNPASAGTDKGDNRCDRIIRIAKRIPCTECDHPKHEAGFCAICEELNLPTCNPNYKKENGGDEETPENPGVNEDGTGHNHSNEVEVNLHGVDKNGEYLESHLSIHIRHAGDVEVFIPVPATYTCEADDMDIVMKHEANHMVHGATYVLKDSENSQYGPLTVSITVEYEENGIRITTHGVTEEVIAWCAEKWDDGITFEVWNYYNDPEKVAELPNGAISLEELQYLLNKATIEFINSNLPDYYINAFKDENNDCTVSIVDEQAGEFNAPETGEHLNGSNLNQIYGNRNLE